MTHGFKKCPCNKCVLVKCMESREYVLVILYVDNILIMSASRNDREWVKDLLENKYEKISVVEGTG